MRRIKGQNESFTPLAEPQRMAVINEFGLYALILFSKLPQAREFKRWVTSEVLGQIRKMGGYILINGCDLVLWFYSSIVL